MKRPNYERLERLKKELDEAIANADLEVGKAINGGSNINELVESLQIYQAELEIQNVTLEENNHEIELLSRYYSLLFSESPIACLIVNKRMDILDANKQADLLFEAYEFIDKNKPTLSAILDQQNRAEFHRAIAAISEYKEPVKIKLEVDHKTQRIYFNVHIALLEDELADNKYIMFLEDITKAVVQDDLIKRTQKLEALGKFTGGIAHDFNNLLGIINGYSDLMADQCKDDERLKRSVQHIKHAGERGASLVAKLLKFSKSEQHSFFSDERKVVNLNELITNALDLVGKSIHSDIILDTLYGGDLWPVYIDESDFIDALINLAVNASHAMEQSGRLHIETTNVHLNLEKAKSIGVATGDYVCLLVKDSGTGIEEDIVAKIFDPFFTTKPDIGSGLGLSQVYGFIKDSKGGVEVKTKLNQGSTFFLYMPKYQVNDI
ncbi:MAG: ATP-binding protein [Kangiellaceae bacterium]|jgi:signal transduction histidine kinase|nr:ATP-binding protein [Kangiellaceae bacterium]